MGPIKGAVFGVFEVSPSVNGKATDTEDDIPFFEAGLMACPSRESSRHVKTTFVFWQFEPAPEVRILGGGGTNAKAWEAYVGAVRGIFQKGRDDIDRDHVADLVL